MKKTLGIIMMLALAAGLAQAATVTWDGETSRFWQIDTNWDTDTAPTDSDDVVINTNTNLLGDKTLDINGVSRAGTVTIDPVWTGGAFVLRVNGTTFTVKTNITFTSNSTVEQGIKGASLAVNAMRMHNAAIINNGTGQVVLSGATAAKTLQIIGVTNENSTLTFGGSGNFKLAANLAIREDDLDRVWTDAAFGGTLTLNGDTDFMDPATNLCIQGGTIKIGANEQIGDTTAIAFGTGAGVTGTLDAQGITETAGILNNFSDTNATISILVDTNTALTFANFNDGATNRGVIDVQGWVEGSSSMSFASLSNYVYTIADGTNFVGLTLDDGTAYMRDVGGGTWVVSDRSGASAPEIKTDGNSVLTSFTTDRLTASASQSFQVWGNNMVDDVTVTSDSSSFEVSLDDSTFSSNVVVAASGILAPTNVYVRVVAGAPAGSLSETLTLSSSNAISQTVNLSATVSGVSLVWTGATDRFWQKDTNWDPTNVPTASDDVVINTNTSFLNGNVMDMSDDSQAGTVTVDPVWTGGEFVLRANGATFTLGSTMTFTTNSTVEQKLRSVVNPAFLRVHNASIINNGTGQVSIFGDNADDPLNFIGNDGDSKLTFGGNGNFNIGTFTAIRESDLERVWTDAAFGGVLTLAGDTDFMDPATDIRVQGGTIKIGANEQIGAGTQVSLFGGSGTLDAQGITETAGLLFSDNDGGTILVDTNTSLTFTDYRKLQAAEGDINISGWSEGNSSLVFTNLGTNYYAGTIAEGEAFVGLTISGTTAYMTETNGNWAVTDSSGSTPPPDISSISVSGGSIILTWDSGSYNVQTNADLTNTNGWGPLENAGSPYTNAIGSEAQLFYRLSN